MKLLDRLQGKQAEERQILQTWPWVDYFESFAFNGETYFPLMSMPNERVTSPDATFEGYVREIHDRHGVVAAAVVARALLLSQLKFKWRNTIDGQNGRLFGTADLGILEHPNSDQTRQEFLTAIEYQSSYQGNAYVHRDGNELRLLRPDWVSILMGSNLNPDEAISQRDATVIGYIYHPGGPLKHETPELLPASEVAHWRPEPDPINWWRGQSWVQSVLTEILLDRAAQQHSKSFFEHAATPQLVFSMDPSVGKQQIEEYAALVEAGHAGAANAYKNLYIGGGADVKVVGADLSRLDMKQVTGLSETRIAMRSRVPAVILQAAEAMQGSSLNSGNYSQTRRLWSDGWFSPTAGALCAVFERVVPPPDAFSELAYDPTTVPFLQDDRLDDAEIQSKTAQTIRTLLDAGFDPAAVVQAVTSGDYSQLGNAHSGLFSVQLQPPGTTLNQGSTAVPAPA